MFTIHPIPAFTDNYIWLIQNGADVACVDPGDAAPVLAYLRQHQLTLQQIWITHHHHDHTGGVADLRVAFPDCRVYGNHDIAQATTPVSEGSIFHFSGAHINVWLSAGHTNSHLSYILHDGTQNHVFCGDTLFSAGCGRVFTGTAQQLYQSLQRFAQMPSETLFYPAHEYTASNLHFALHIEPNNAAMQTALTTASHTPTLPVALNHECEINPFLRTHLPAVAQRVATLSGQNLGDEISVFAAMRELKNQF